MSLHENKANNDLTIKTEDGFFNHRVGCLIFNDKNQVLLQDEREDIGIYYLPGGRIAFGETSEQSLLREIEEELFVAPESYELAAVIENYFTYDGDKFHENGMYYRVTLPEGLALPDKCAEGNKIVFEWVDIDKLPEIDLKPSLFKTRMKELQSGFTHIMHHDDLCM